MIHVIETKTNTAYPKEKDKNWTKLINDSENNEGDEYVPDLSLLDNQDAQLGNCVHNTYTIVHVTRL